MMIIQTLSDLEKVLVLAHALMCFCYFEGSDLEGLGPCTIEEFQDTLIKDNKFLVETDSGTRYIDVNQISKLRLDLPIQIYGHELDEFHIRLNKA